MGPHCPEQRKKRNPTFMASAGSELKVAKQCAQPKTETHSACAFNIVNQIIVKRFYYFLLILPLSFRVLSEPYLIKFEAHSLVSTASSREAPLTGYMSFFVCIGSVPRHLKAGTPSHSVKLLQRLSSESDKSAQGLLAYEVHHQPCVSPNFCNSCLIGT
jgi:hypothetical protein